MKGLILSGGSGTRMRPLTHSVAKQLLPIANVPIIHRAIRQMSEVGIHEVAIVVGGTAEQVKLSVGDGSQFGVNVCYIPQDQPLGLAHCVKIARDFLREDDFVMFLGDNMFEDGLQEIVSQFETNKAGLDAAAHVAVKQVPNPSSFGVAVVDNNFELLSVEEKPISAKSNLALVGTYCFTSAIHNAIDSISPSPRGELEITDAIEQLLKDGLRVGVSEVPGWWFDTGNPASFLECNAKVLEAGVTDLYNSTPDVLIIEPCAIDPSATLSNCTIGPNVSVGAAVSVNGSTISNSVLLEQSSISGHGAITDSIVGKRSSIKTLPNTVSRVILGDDCDVEVGS